MRRILPVLVLAMGTLVITASPGAAGGGGCYDGPTEGTGATVEMSRMCFSPTVLRIEPGTEVTFVNRDPLAHVVRGVGWGDGKQLGTGDRITHRFDEVGAFPYTCNLHPGMNGVIVVGDGEPLATAPISTSREESSTGVSPAWFGLGVALLVAGVFAGRLTARSSTS